MKRIIIFAIVALMVLIGLSYADSETATYKIKFVNNSGQPIRGKSFVIVDPFTRKVISEPEKTVYDGTALFHATYPQGLVPPNVYGPICTTDETSKTSVVYAWASDVYDPIHPPSGISINDFIFKINIDLEKEILVVPQPLKRPIKIIKVPQILHKVKK